MNNNFYFNRPMESEHFTIYYQDTDKNCINRVLKILEDSYMRITEMYNEQIEKKIEIEIYTQFSDLHKALGLAEDAPDWIRGGVKPTGVIAIASPLNPPPGSNFDNVLSTAVHEFVHIIVSKINRNIPRWLNEGIASYEGKDNNYNWIEKTLKEGIINRCIPSIGDLDTGEDYELFFKRNGYQYSYALVKWVINEYGYDALIKLIKSDGDFDKALNLSDNMAEEKWKLYIKNRYK